MKKVRIVLAEDNPGDIYLVRLALQEIEHELHEVRDGEQALDLITQMGQDARV